MGADGEIPVGAGGENDGLPSGAPSLICFAAMLGFLGKPADPAHLRHDLGLGSNEAMVGDLLRLARRLEVKAKPVRATAARLCCRPWRAWRTAG